ncbi:MAG: S41 family peptidase [Planctomycetota bacterium]
MSIQIALALLAPTLLASPFQNEPNAATVPDAVMLRYPAASADSIAFRYAGDLWLVPREGGTATRITSAPGNESFPQFSPDGTRLAFMADYDGGTELYVMPTRGGVPERVTWHPTQEILCGWMPDGERLLYWSPEEAGLRRAPRLMTVDVDGGQPVALPLAYATFGAVDPTGRWLAFTPQSREFRTWKRYQGGLAQDIWLYDLETGASRRVTDFPGTDAQPMWHGRELLFVSDRGPDAVLNLYSYDIDDETVEELTHFTEFGVRFANAGPRDVVFENGGRLYRYDLEARKLVAVDVTVPGDRPELRPERRSVEENLAGASPGPTGERVVVEARGELFTVPKEEGFTRALTRTSGAAERSPAWSPDGKWIAYFSDRTGEYELTIRRADGATFDGADASGQRTVTSIGEGFRTGTQWSPDGEKITFTDNAGNLWLVRTADWSASIVDTNPAGFPMDCAWSATSDWIAFSHRHPTSNLEAIFLHSLASGETTCVTSGQFDDSNPVFGPEGDYLYFHSTRHFEPEYGDLDTTWIYANSRMLLAVPLRADVDVPLAPENDDEPIARDDSEDGDAKGGDGSAEDEDVADEAGEEPAHADEEVADDDASDAKKGDDEAKQLVVDLDGFEARAVLLPVEPGSISNLAATNKGLLFVRGSGRGEGGPGSLVLVDYDEFEEQTVLGGVGGFSVCAKADQVLVMSRGKLAVVAIAPGQKMDEPLDLSGLVVEIDPRAEWRQMLVETWRLFRDYFYQESMHGLDWPAVRERYLGALADATSRDDLAFLCGEMMAELNVGHAYNGRSPSARPDAPERPAAGLLGADFGVVDGRLVVERIVGGGAYDADARGPLAFTEVRPGDALLAVNGTPVDPTKAVYAAMLGTAGHPTQLTFSHDPSDPDSHFDVLVEPLRDDTDLRYRDWVAAKRARVAELSGGRIGYVHVPSTGIDGQNELVRQFLGAMRSPALLVDERWNSGGQIPTRFIELLNRPLTNKWAVRHGEDWNWPPDGHRGPKAMLINGWAGSGGDAFPYYFRQSGLGKLVGRRTWGGLVGLSGNPSLIDGTSHSIPTFGFYELDGTWGIEGHGVPPDVEVMDDPSALARGEDPQLEAAVALLLEELERAPFVDPKRPTAPDRSGSGIPAADH